jgi:alkylhydroperoxidase family enzyme
LFSKIYRFRSVPWRSASDGIKWQGLLTISGGKKEAAILALLTSRSVEDAARTAEVPLRTLYRWMNEPQFDAVYRKAKRVAFGQAVSRLQQGTGAAAAVMLMADTATPASTRLRAADCVFGHAKSAIEMEEIEARIAALEQAAELSKQSR